MLASAGYAAWKGYQRYKGTRQTRPPAVARPMRPPSI